MNWNQDEMTITFLQNHLPVNFTTFIEPGIQFQGKIMNTVNWGNKLPENHPLGTRIISSPENIIECFSNDYFLEGLALTVLWGTMVRQQRRIYTRELNNIKEALKVSKDLIIDDNNINKAWNHLQETLGWSSVIISKTLHFLSRSLGHIYDCPVAIDNAIILQRVWPALIKDVNETQRPNTWMGGLEGYLRYMTLINYLKVNFYPEWTNTQIETKFFNEFRKLKLNSKLYD